MIALNAVPLVKHSSLHKFSFLSLLGIKTKYSPSLSIAFNFNLQTQPQQTNSQLTFYLRDAQCPPLARSSDFCINNLRRWRLNIFGYDSFEGFLQNMNRRLYKRYQETQKIFLESGAKLSVVEGEWSPYVDAVYQLYLKVAKKNGAQLYDLNFFQQIAKLKEYKLMCIWHNDCLIGALIMVDEEPIFHSAICAMDYEYSKKCRAYSQMHYQIIRLAIEAKKYSIVDIGITADKAKSLLNYHPVPSCMDICVRNRVLKNLLHLLSRLITATINADSKIEFSFNFSRRK